MLFISFFFGIIRVVVSESCIYCGIAASIAEAAAVIPNGAKMIFANGTATFINRRANAKLLNNEHRSPPDWIILDIWDIRQLYISWHVVFNSIS